MEGTAFRRVCAPGIVMNYIYASSEKNFEVAVRMAMTDDEWFEYGPGYILAPQTGKPCRWVAVKLKGALGVCHPDYVRYVWVKIRKGSKHGKNEESTTYAELL